LFDCCEWSGPLVAEVIGHQMAKEACYEGCRLITSVDEEVFEAEVG